VLHAKAAGPDVEAGPSVQVASASPAPVQAAPVATAQSEAASTTDAQVATGPESLPATYFAAWSDAKDPDGLGIRRFYAPLVKFYGRDIALEELMKQKVAFARRWPSRTYTARPASFATKCRDAHTCTISGVVDWQAANEAAGRRVSGVATFAMTVRDGLIDGEAGSVLARQ
jgi:hypothetical protein